MPSLPADAPHEPDLPTDRLARLRVRLFEIAAAVTPGRDARLGAAVGATALAMAAAAFLSWRVRPGLGAAGDLALGALAGLAAVLLVTAATVAVLALAGRLPRLLTGVLLGAVATMAYVIVLPDVLKYALGAAGVLLTALLCGLMFSIARGSLQGARTARWLASGTALVLLGSAAALTLLWVAWPGAEGNRSAATAVAHRTVAELNAPDPAQPGPHAVHTLTYGSGDDRLRQEYGADVGLRTDAVNAASFVQWSGLGKRLLEWRWGFDTTQLPLNGRVWYPAGDGPFPLVLVVHGNHNLFEFSDPGYAYLGELLASRGYIVAAVDENFLNGGVYGQSRGENDARSWLLLKHLEAWRNWHRSPGNPFAGKVDLDRIALIGHSRGGEAVATAAALNTLQRHPDNARRLFDFGFGIRSVVAFAPSDGQYRPAGRLNDLTGVSYLVLHGAHDSDIANFSGLRQFDRLDLGGGPDRSGPDRADRDAGSDGTAAVGTGTGAGAGTDGNAGAGAGTAASAAAGTAAVGGNRPQRPFKAALYIEGVNHGQFNSVWGRRDRTAPTGWLLNTKPLMPGEEQRRLATVYISAFLDDTLRDVDTYRPLFRDHFAGVAAGWLPETTYISRYADAGYRIVASFEEDVDVTTATVDGGLVHARGLTVWREKLLLFRTGKSQENSAAVIGWSRPGSSYKLSLPAGLAGEWGLGEDSLLVMAIAQADRDPPGQVAPSAPGGPGSPGGLLDLSVEIADSNGTVASVPLSAFGAIPPPIRSRLTKLPPWESRRFRKDSQPILQTVEIPLAAFVAAAPGLDLGRVSSVTLRFDRSPSGVMLLDDLGFDVDG